MNAREVYQDTQLLIGSRWVAGSDADTIEVQNPATGDVIGNVAKASEVDINEAAGAAEVAFLTWRTVSAFDRSALLRAAAQNVRERAERIALLLTLEQGKALAESRAEVAGCAAVLEWSAEEARRVYDRMIPARRPGVSQRARRQPIGPVVAITPWNFPVSQVVKKVAPALAAGCSVIVKASEETPASAAEIVRAIADAGLPSGVLQLLYGIPSEISAQLICHPAIRKISFTGSVPVGKHLAAMAGENMRRATMELGGHAPAIICRDADVESAAKLLASSKFRNSGQVCVSPTRFIIEECVYDDFVGYFMKAADTVIVGDGLDPSTTMGPLINDRRRTAVNELIVDAIGSGAKLQMGGKSQGDKGSFYRPTVLSDVDISMRIMNEEPFGPVALMSSFRHIEDAIAEANRLPFGLASYAFTRSSRQAELLANEVEAGMLTINHLGLALPETPFGGVKDSGYGSEGGAEGIEPYLVTKFVSHDTYV